MKCEASAACDEERVECHCLMSAVAGEHICLCVTYQIGFDLMSLNSIEVPAVLPCPAYVLDPLVSYPKDVLSWQLEVLSNGVGPVTSMIHTKLLPKPKARSPAHHPSRPSLTGL